MKQEIQILKKKVILFWKKIFYPLGTYKKLSIIKYNKNVQEKLGIAPNDFKEATQTEPETKIKRIISVKIKLINIEENENNINDYFTIYLN